MGNAQNIPEDFSAARPDFSRKKFQGDPRWICNLVARRTHTEDRMVTVHGK